MKEISLKEHLSKIAKDRWKNMTVEQRETQFKKMRKGRKLKKKKI